jgi:hypothetical protein
MWLPYGQAYLQSFIASYLAFPAGHEHTLYILFNGARDSQEVAACQQLLQEAGITYKEVELPQGQDITAYFYATGCISEDYILFLNTYSRFLHPQWLAKYAHALASTQDIGLVGATASCQSYYSSVFQTHSLKWERQKGFTYNYRKYKLFLKAIGYWYFLFRPFPAPHIRTNAFMIQRKLFQQLAGRALRDKLAAYQFESGRKSLTNGVTGMGYLAVVIDKSGEIHLITACKKRPIFWNGNQEDLLISDNQTTLYQEADVESRKLFRKLAWGTNE